MRKIKILPPLEKIFEKVVDPRNDSGKRHSLLALLKLTVSAMLSGAITGQAIAEWGRSRSRDELKQLGFKRGISPCAMTLLILFKRMDSVAFENALRDYFSPILSNEEVIAVDGKTLRGSRDGVIPAVHLLSALGQKTCEAARSVCPSGYAVIQRSTWMYESRVVFNEYFVSHKTNEIKVIVPLLDELKINGKVITADALHTQKGFCEYVVDHGGDYLLTVKDNQKGLREDISDCFVGDFPPQESKLPRS